ncbi:MAG: sterol desaturase family protein [Pseudomonadota bacterium]
MTEFLSDIGITLFAMLISWESRVALVYLGATILIVFLLWLYRGRPETFLRWALPASVYLHKSNRVDFQVFVFNIVMSVLGLFAVIGFATFMTLQTIATLSDWFARPDLPAEATLWRSLLATLIMVLILDFCRYCAHWLHHENRILWPFHALHHSAEVLTPLTSFRVHPVFLLVRDVIYSVGVGIVQGVMLFALMGEIDLVTIGSANAGYVLFNVLGSNLRHSHIWLSYGPVMEHVFISPAQHQIHHSSAPRHHNKNYGEIFAFWDWMFGTLYVPKEQEILEFGLADAQGNLIEQPHPTLFAAIVHPFFDSWHELQAKLKEAPKNVEEAPDKVKGA